MTLYFVTGKQAKFDEAKRVIPKIEQLVLDLTEIQSMDPEDIIARKLDEAFTKTKDKGKDREIVCEDTSLYIGCLNGLPGPLIKWFLERLGNDGIYQLVSPYKEKIAIAKTVVGYLGNGKRAYFSGEIPGEIVKPKGETNFGWDPIFLPRGYKQTFAEMKQEEKIKISMRTQAFTKLKEYLDGKPHKSL